MTLPCFADNARNAIPITPLAKAALAGWSKAQPAAVRRWVKQTGFTAGHGAVCLIAAEDGAIARVLVGLGSGEGPLEPVIWAFGGLPAKLPAGRYRLDGGADIDATAAAIGWGLGAYRFGRYRKGGAKKRAVLAMPAGADAKAAENAVAGTWLARDLVNTPAADLGPAELAKAAMALGKEFGAKAKTVSGAALRKGYPAVATVGGGSPRSPKVADLRWQGPGGRKAPLVVLAGKGVVFDTGGLDIKPASAMKLMKKDMGGAAQVLGLARMIMAAKLPVRLRVLIGAAENAVSGRAMRPLDVIQTRAGKTVEIGHTDAEGRLVLCDLLDDGAADKPALMVDCATLTGAARVALGTDLPAMFANDERIAEALLARAAETDDPLWRLPLWTPYRRLLNSSVADLNNVGSAPMGGAITAALFLADFVPPDIPWVHLDLMAWNTATRPGRPAGGEAMGLRALFRLIEKDIAGK